MAEEAKRGLTYDMALREGFEPGEYDWKNIPEGTWPARLDFKIWSNKSKVGHLVCYMTSLDNSQRYRLSAFRQGTERHDIPPKTAGSIFQKKALKGISFWSQP